MDRLGNGASATFNLAGRSVRGAAQHRCVIGR